MKKIKFRKALEYLLLAIYFFGSVSMQILAADTSNTNCSVIMTFVDKYWEWVLILAPVGLIILGAMDFVKATATGDNDAIKKASSNFIKRAIAVVLLFLLKPLLKMVFTIFGLETHSCFRR